MYVYVYVDSITKKMKSSVPNINIQILNSYIASKIITEKEKIVSQVNSTAHLCDHKKWRGDLLSL